MFSKLFWKDAVERVISTMAQTLLTFGTLDAANLTAVNIKVYIVGVVLAGLYSLVKALAALKATDGNSASLTVSNIKAK